MDRRRFITTTALLGAGALAGCNTSGSELPPSPPEAPDGVADWSFSAPVEDADVGRNQPPQVTCDPNAGRVRVVGVAPSGNGCSSLYADRVTLDDGLLTLVVAAWHPDRSCSDVARFPGYEATFSLETRLPDRVRTVEPADPNGDETRTTTVDC
ncbi:hypothetical protein [Halobacterium jilantaiense]|uniref:Tat (Twin-arginine translocation) pathway signal sequence n=1 Tax=Halobacterium jilantaiense TaxID=355548 RepID=A0A1I0PBQ2_9EURY|nr:hypothetical protein [Halobacterium jilantaiense]SEW11823.1 hypothetical protein SAMN04487945_1576 [Halobacterium jilantaiense]